jgi:hypothetical protein
MHLLQSCRPSASLCASPLANAPGDLLIEIALCLESRADLLHLSLAVRLHLVY